MNKLHYKAIRKGVIIWNRYSRFCRFINPAWRANLREANLREAHLRGADLYGANLREAHLRGADLYGANLREADLWGADLRGANFREAFLRGADLREADLRGANLRGAGVVADIAGYRVLAWPGGARVGCQSFDLADWQAMTPEAADKIARGGGAWWWQYGPVVIAMIESMGQEVLS